MSSVSLAKSEKQPTQTLTQDPQRQLLQQLATLSVECAKEEERIDQEYQRLLAEHQATVSRARSLNDEKHTRNVSAVNDQRIATAAEILQTHRSAMAALELRTRQAKSRAEQDKAVVDEQARKQVEQARWLAESVLEAVGSQLEIQARQAKELQASRKAEVENLHNAATASLAAFEQAPVPVEPIAGPEITARLDKEPDAVYDEYRDRAVTLLNQTARLRIPKMVSGGAAYLLAFAACAVMAGLAQMSASELSQKLVAGAFGAGIGIAGSIVGIIRLRVIARRQIVELFTPLGQAIDLARRAAETSFTRNEEERTEREREERRKCAKEVDAARERMRPEQRRAGDERARVIAEIEANHEAEARKISDQRKQAGDELERTYRDASEAAEHAYEHEKQRIDEEDRSRAARIEADHDRQSQELLARWNNSLHQLTLSLVDAQSTANAPLDWHSEAWEHWKSPKTFTPSVPFGTLKVDLQSLTAVTPKRLALPDTFSIPAILAFPHRGSMLIDTDHASRGDAIATASLAMARLLTHMPAGRVKFTIIDPVGLGQSFAGFMHLADHDESLVGSRIWTETEHIEQRLADLTEHMETVIQKYLRNEYQSIDQYNAQAGELAEPTRYLVISDFPTGFEQETLRRLASIATSGARCGVHTIIIRDTRQPLPQGSRFEELVTRSIHLAFKDHKLSWNDEVFAKFPLTLDPAPDEKALTSIMERVGLAAREAKRVEVPFRTIAPEAKQFWTGSSRDDLKVPIGKSGATRLQSLRLGVGVAQHALLAGKTGSGKSNLMHTIVTNLAMWYSPDEVEFYLVDFKKGVEFKAYVSRELAHARAIAVESDREFGLSVLQRVDAELTRRGEMFRAIGVQEISSYRQQTGKTLPRTVLLIDEFQEFFSEDDKLGQEASVLLDRLVRQGRAFGVHVILGSQTIGGSSGLSRSTISQMAVRIALQCSEADSQMILGDNNSAARLLTRPGEAIYNDAGGLVEANSPFQIAFLPDDQRDQYLRAVQTLSRERQTSTPQPVVFEGNAPAEIRKNAKLMALLDSPNAADRRQVVAGWIGEPVSIKDPTFVPFRPQSGSNALLIGQHEELAISAMSSMIISIAAQQPTAAAKFVVLDGSAADSPLAQILPDTLAAIPHPSQKVAYREVEQAILDLGEELARREAESGGEHPCIYLFIYAIQRYRMLRRQEEEFSFSRSEEEPKAKPDKVFARLITEGPALGIHVVAWADTAITLDRTFDRGLTREFDHRVLFQMSAADSSNLIDSPAANKLGTFRALSYSEEQGTAEKFRPYQLPDRQWLEEVASKLKARNAPAQ